LVGVSFASHRAGIPAKCKKNGAKFVPNINALILLLNLMDFV
jgi:hypothetical protein